LALTPSGGEGEAEAEARSGEEQLGLVLATLRRQDEQLAREMDSVKQLLAGGGGAQQVVYVGPEMRTLLDEAGRKLEREIKLNTLAQVVLVYAALAVALPLLLRASP